MAGFSYGKIDQTEDLEGKSGKPEKTTPKKTQKNNGTPHHHFDDEVTIKLKISPRKVFKWVAVILVLVLVFYLGRITVDCPTVGETVEDSADFSKVSGFFTSLFGTEEGEDKATGAVVVEAEPDSKPKPEVEEEEIVEEEPEVKSTEVNEEIITDYSKVALSFSDVKVDWKDTWGKIETIKYTLKNNELGTIKPEYFLMLVEGYDDFEKKVPLPKSSQTIKSKVIASSVATIPSGFAYSELTAGDLSNVEIILQLYDGSANLIAFAKKTVDLNPE